MSTVSVTNLKHESASGNNITLDSSNRVGIDVSDMSSSGANAKLAVGGGVINLDDGMALAWGGGTSRPSVKASKTAGTFEVDIGGPARLFIDSSGRVTMPYQPAFYATRTAGSVSSTTTVVYDSVTTNIGGHYNSSTGVFTAPVSGMYQFNHVGISNNTTSTTTLDIQKNGTTFLWMYSWAGSNTYTNCSFSFSVYLSTSDTIKIRVINGSLYAAGDGGNPRFMGYLIG